MIEKEDATGRGSTENCARVSQHPDALPFSAVMQMSKGNTNSNASVQGSIDPNRDHWGQPVEQYEPETGAGDRCQCLRCGTRHDIALVAGTVPDVESNKWEEFRRCTICGAEGSLRVSGSERRWTGMIEAVEESIR